MYSCWWTVTKNYRVKHFMVSILREFTVLLMLTHSLFTLCRCQIFKDCIPVVEQANSVIHCPWWSRHPIVSKRAPLARLQCVQFGLCVISERLLYWRSSSVSYCLWRAESMVLCWQDWWGNSYQDCGGNTFNGLKPCNFSNILCGMKCLRKFAIFVFCGNKFCN